MGTKHNCLVYFSFYILLQLNLVLYDLLVVNFERKILVFALNKCFQMLGLPGFKCNFKAF